jgi:hypothetical protein
MHRLLPKDDSVLTELRHNGSGQMGQFQKTFEELNLQPCELRRHR